MGTFRVLHTADWHLGQRLVNGERDEEHALFLGWLRALIRDRAVDALIVAGDIFDKANPSNLALEQYYQFLAEVSSQSRCSVVITGGNHDSPRSLEAPADLLRALRIHVVGALPERLEDAILSLPFAEAPQLCVCAIPYLREQDVRRDSGGETIEEREGQLREGIARIYRQCAELTVPHREAGRPILMMGHLFAQGGKLSDGERPIHIGNLGQVDSGQLLEGCDYLALGHLHRPQWLDAQGHVRYAGSPIPLSFSEAGEEKSAVLLEFDASGTLSVEELPIPEFRVLRVIRSAPEFLLPRLEGVAREAEEAPLKEAWVAIELEGESFAPEVDREVQAMAENLPIRIMRVKLPTREDSRAGGWWFSSPDDGKGATPPAPVSLDELSPRQVFAKRLEEAGWDATSDDTLAVGQAFDKLLDDYLTEGPELEGATEKGVPAT